MKTCLLKSAARNNDIESQENRACFQTYRTVVFIRGVTLFTGMFQKVDR